MMKLTNLNNKIENFTIKFISL